MKEILWYEVRKGDYIKATSGGENCWIFKALRYKEKVRDEYPISIYEYTHRVRAKFFYYLDSADVPKVKFFYLVKGDRYTYWKLEKDEVIMELL